MRLTLLLALLVATACSHRPGGAAVALAPAAAIQGGRPQVELVDLAGDPVVVRWLHDALPAALDAAGRWGRMPSPLRIVIHPDHRSLEAATGISGADWILAWARDGVVDLQAPRSWPGRSGSASETASILTHELTHLVLYAEAGEGGAWAARGIPLWFREGMASVTAGEVHPAPRVDDGRVRVGPGAVQAASHHAFLLLRARHGEAGIRRLVRAVGDGARFDAAFEAALGVPLGAFEAELGARQLLAAGPST